MNRRASSTSKVAPLSSRALRAERRASSQQQEAADATSMAPAHASLPFKTAVAAAGGAATSNRQSSTTLAPQQHTSSAVAVSLEKQPKRKIRSQDDDEGHESSSSVKKARLDSSVRRYNLRSTSARTSRTVTPSRQILFDSSSDDDDDSSTVLSDLPTGVVDIFRKPPKRTDDSSTLVVGCRCPVDRSVAKDTAMATLHLQDYGRDCTAALRQSERRQLVDVFGERALIEEEQDDDDYGTDDEDDLAAFPGTLRYRRLGVANILLGLGNYLVLDSRSDLMPRQPYITTHMRAVLINWMVEMGMEYKISTHAFHLSITLLDSVLARGPSQSEYLQDDQDEDYEDIEETKKARSWEFVHRQDFQALGCACAWIASKMEDRSPPEMEDFVYISDHSFPSNKLRQFEQRICRLLSFKLSRVTPVHFLNQFLRASHACPCPSCQFDHPVLRQMVNYLLELGRVSFDLSFRPPSLLAAAAVYLGRATLGLRETHPDRMAGTTGYWTQTLQYTTGYTLDDLRSTVLILHKFHLASETQNSSFTKYKKSDNGAVALKTVRRIEELDFDDFILPYESIRFTPGDEESDL